MSQLLKNATSSMSLGSYIPMLFRTIGLLDKYIYVFLNSWGSKPLSLISQIEPKPKEWKSIRKSDWTQKVYIQSTQRDNIKQTWHINPAPIDIWDSILSVSTMCCTSSDMPWVRYMYMSSYMYTSWFMTHWVAPGQYQWDFQQEPAAP
jgi:hypothetical protein